MNFLAIIPARYASTRFPGKPLAVLGGKPVIQRVYEQVAGVLDDAVVATDDERIRDAVRAFGGRVEMTSPDHRSGTDRCWEAYCKQGREYDVVVNVQGDEPFIHPSQLEAVKRCFDDPATDIATLVKPFTEADGLAALENPNSPKVVLDAQSRAIYFSRSVIPYLRGVPREEWLARHTFYKHIGLYAFRADVLRRCRSRRLNWPNRLSSCAGWRTVTRSAWGFRRSRPSASTRPKTWRKRNASSIHNS